MSKEPKFQVLESFGKIELRLYEPFLVAEVKMVGERKEAIDEGFDVLADYLFGNNQASKSMPMSIPVTQQLANDHWTVRFMLTSESQIENLPLPNNPNVHLLQIEAKKLAIIRFSGFFSDKKMDVQIEKLQRFAGAHEWRIKGQPILAFYNPPWALPFLRRNEVMLEIAPRILDKD